MNSNTTHERDDSERRRAHFLSLDREQKSQAIKRLAFSGMGDDAIASATGLSTEMVRRILANNEVRS